MSLMSPDFKLNAQLNKRVTLCVGPTQPVLAYDR